MLVMPCIEGQVLRRLPLRPLRQPNDSVHPDGTDFDWNQAQAQGSSSCSNQSLVLNIATILGRILASYNISFSFFTVL